MATYYGQDKVDVGVYIETDRLVLSAEEYAAIPVKDPNTMYLVYDDPQLVAIINHMENKSIHSHVSRLNLTLAASAWVGAEGEYKQSVSAPGVSADEQAQLINIIAASASKPVYEDCGVYASAQTTDTLEFTCSKQPTTNLVVYAVIQEIGGM